MIENYSDMQCVSTREIRRSQSSHEKEYHYIYKNDNLKNIKNYDDVKNQFNNFKLLEEFEYELMYEEHRQYMSKSYCTVFICYGIPNRDYDSALLFSFEIDITSLIGPDYNYSFKESDFSIFNNFLKRNKNKMDEIYLSIRSETTFYHDYLIPSPAPQPESEDENYDRIPAIIEDSFATDNCLVCLTNQPNILNFPCLHLSVCKSCEETGRFLNCSVCRKKIERKVKI